VTQALGHCPATCTCTTNVKEVECSGKQLNAVPELQGTNITTLDVSFNNISQIQCNEFDEWCRQLKIFYLNNNNMKNIETREFRMFPELIHLYLDNNLITEIDPYTFEKNHKLWKLTLNGNTLTLHEDTGFLNVPSLGWLELENCNITYMPVNIFKNMSRLVYIRLSNNHIQQLHIQLFSHLKNLRHLHLEGNLIKEIGPNIFKSNHRIEWLYLRNNPLNHFTRDHFLHAPSLIELDIGFCNISQIPDKFFSNLHNLLSLRLKNNRLKSFNMIHIPKNLQVLDISGNSLTTINITKNMINHMTNIKHLVLTNNKFTCDCNLIDVWLWCAKLRNVDRGINSCDEFCPKLESATCEGQDYQIYKVRKTSEGFSGIKSERNYKYLNTSSEDIYVDHEGSDNQENKDTETIDGVPIDSEKDANKTIGKYKIKDESDSSVSGLNREKLWDIIFYSCIGIFGGVLFIGLTVLVFDTVSVCRKARGNTKYISDNSSLRNVRLKLMEENDDRQETRPLSQHQGFDFVSFPAEVNTAPRRGKSRPSTVKP
jgi:Leucine-rich repeat (LRR) protein